MRPGSHQSVGAEPLIERLRRATIGRYDIYAELGSGGMATVFLALDLALDRKVAIKVLAPSLADSPDNVTRFKREAKVAAALDHPNIIGILAVGDDEQLAYFVMKYVEGRALDSVIAEEGAQGVAFVRSVVASAGQALHFAHQRGVIHRDVKPANLMLDLEGRLIVTDFGIAKHDSAHALTVTGSVIGTPYYMSPEQFNGLPVTGATDQYALGVVAFELLTGQQPYPGKTVGEVMRGHLFDPIPSVRSLRAELPESLDAVIARMLAKRPEERFASLEAAVHALASDAAVDAHEARTQIIALARSGAQRRPELRVPVSPAPAVRARTVPLGRPRRRGTLALLTFALVAGAAAATIGLRPDLVGLGASATDRADAASPDSTPTAATTTIPQDTQPPTAAETTPSEPAPSEPTPSETTPREITPREITTPTRPRRPLGNAGERRLGDRVVDSSAAASSAPVAPTGGIVRVGSRIQLSALYVNDNAPVPARGLQRLELPAGPVRLSIRSRRCATWDTTFTVVAGETHTIGYRPARC